MTFLNIPQLERQGADTQKIIYVIDLFIVTHDSDTTSRYSHYHDRRCSSVTGGYRTNI